MNRRALFLHEELLLLALRDREGTLPACASQLPFALGGALLAELLLSERVRVVKHKKKEFLEGVDRSRLDEPVLDECLQKVADASRRATLQTWVGRFARLKRLKRRVARELCALRILRHDEDRVLFLFKRQIYPEVDSLPERELIERLRLAIFGHDREVPPRTVVLLSLANATGMLKLVFDKKELKRRKERIKKLAEGELCGKAAKKAIEAMQAAVLVATVVSTVMVIPG